MANTTELILLPIAEEPSWDEEGYLIVEDYINGWLRERQLPLFNLVKYDNKICGSFSSPIYVVGFKAAPVVELIDFIFSQPWQNPESLVLLVDSDSFADCTWNVFKSDNYKEMIKRLWGDFTSLQPT